MMVVVMLNAAHTRTHQRRMTETAVTAFGDLSAAPPRSSGKEEC